MADHARARFSKSSGRDFSRLSTSEAVDLIQQVLFPDLGPWAGMATPLVYRLRPHADNPEECSMETMLLFAKNPEGSHPPAGRPTIVGVHERWHAVPGRGAAADVTDRHRLQRPARVAQNRNGRWVNVTDCVQ